MADIQETVAAIADELVASGAERGLQVAAYVDQQQVVDVAAGVADPATGREVRPGTLFYNWSIGKGATATLVHRLVDAGQLEGVLRILSFLGLGVALIGMGKLYGTVLGRKVQS